MIAVVKIGGHQAIVKEGDVLEVDKIDVEKEKSVKFETLLISEEDGCNFEVGDPVLGQLVEAKVLEHGRGEKIRVFKMKPRKRYRRVRGHRQDYTVIEITKVGKSKPTVSKEKEAPSEKTEKPKDKASKSEKNV